MSFNKNVNNPNEQFGASQNEKKVENHCAKEYDSAAKKCKFQIIAI